MGASLVAQTPPATNSARKDEADKAWTQVSSIGQPTVPDTPPGAAKSAAAREIDRRNLAATFVTASDQARDFYSKYPEDTRAKDAKKLEATNLLRAVEAGEKGQGIKAQQLGTAFREDKANSASGRFEVAVLMNQLKVRDAVALSQKQVLDEYEKSARSLMGEFTNVSDAYHYFWGVARNSEPTKAAAMASELLVLPAPEGVKLEARRLLERLGMAGKPLELNFTAEDGTAFDLQKQKGKITVIYVWGNTSQASIASMGKIKSAVKPSDNYIGVNIDTDIAAAKATAKQEGLPGIQVYDAKGLNSAPVQQLRVGQIPSVYVVDNKGVLTGIGTPDDLTRLLTSGK